MNISKVVAPASSCIGQFLSISLLTVALSGCASSQPGTPRRDPMQASVDARLYLNKKSEAACAEGDPARAIAEARQSYALKRIEQARISYVPYESPLTLEGLFYVGMWEDFKKSPGPLCRELASGMAIRAIRLLQDAYDVTSSATQKKTILSVMQEMDVIDGDTKRELKLMGEIL